MKKILIVTAHTGYNYGTYLQAYAMRNLFGCFADQADIVWEKTLGGKGRDFRTHKIAMLCLRSCLHFKEFKQIKEGYKKNFEAEPNEEIKKYFDDFSSDFLQINYYSKIELRKIARDDEVIAVVCGSDQIWNASSFYPDPLYYLQFAPIYKRIAYAPSFGRIEVPRYNKRIIRTYINSIPRISVREEEGAHIVNSLTGKSVPVMPDPTLVVDWSEWMNGRKENALVVYFLDEPDVSVINEIKALRDLLGLRIKVLLHEFSNYRYLEDYDVINVGPRGFVEIIGNSRFVCTDSFHASIFSIIGETAFYTYPRNYGIVANQENRIINLLKHYKLIDRYRIPNSIELNVNCNFEEAKQIRSEDRKYAFQYIEQSLNDRKG